MLAKSEKYKKVLNEYLNLVPPILVSIAVGFAGIQMADTIMVGRLGSKFLAAASFANSLFGVFFIFSIGIGVAITPMISAAFSKKDFQQSTKILKHGLFLNFIISLILLSLMIILIQNSKYLKQPKEVINLAIPYMYIIAFSIIINCLKDILKRYIEGAGLAKVSMLASIITFFTNVILNYILINGKLGFPELKLIGAGIATFIARLVDTSIIAIYIFYKLKKKGYIKDFMHIKLLKSKFTELLKICLPSAFQLTLEVGFFAVLNIMIGWIGIKYQAAHAIAINISRTSFVVPLSISIAASIIIGRYNGQKNNKMIKITGLIAYFMVFLFYIIISIIIIKYFNNILLAYKAEYIIEKILKMFLPIFILFQIADGFNVVGVNLLRGIQDTFIPVVITSSAQWLFGIPIAYFLSIKMNIGIEGLWLAGFITFVTSAIFLFFRFKYKIK